jgi:hypothetical protein
MKMKVAQTGDVFAAVNAASTKLSVDCAPLARPIGAQDQYTVKAEDDLKALARGNEADVLMPSKHVIGEVHTASEFDRITGEWPGITAMGEGHYTVKETGLDLPATRGDGHANFEHVMRALGSPVLPLDNYHAAAIARLTGFLVIWNEYEHNRSTIVEGHLRRRVSDLLDAIFVYSSVSTEVYNKGNQNRRFWQRSPRYRGDIEKAYGSMDGVLTTANARVAVAHLKRIVAAIGSGGRIPAMSGKDFASVRNLLGEMVPSIANILSISAKGEAAGAQVATGAGTAAMYVKRNLGTLRERDMPTALSQIGPTRERLMKQQIDSIPKPALIKVGRAHIPGLASLSISDVTLYDDASDFDTALPKSADDL